MMRKRPDRASRAAGERTARAVSPRTTRKMSAAPANTTQPRVAQTLAPHLDPERFAIGASGGPRADHEVGGQKDRQGDDREDDSPADDEEAAGPGLPGGGREDRPSGQPQDDEEDERGAREHDPAERGDARGLRPLGIQDRLNAGAPGQQPRPTESGNQPRPAPHRPPSGPPSSVRLVGRP